MRLGVVLKYKVNTLARAFYRMQGYVVPEGYDFSKAKHPQERLCWEQALLAYEFWKESK